MGTVDDGRAAYAASRGSRPALEPDQAAETAVGRGHLLHTARRKDDTGRAARDALTKRRADLTDEQREQLG